ncbi:MAG TPA: 3-oxoadipate enol-lactonase [Nocardioidaceae bacterium]|nr:3-oxoadipate enol-lactonase [Nocardioidaceae bacterium]
MTATVRLAHRVDGPADGPPVVLAPSLGTTLELWDGLAAALAERYRVVRFDTRGHGCSPVPDGPYTLSELAHDVVGVADELELERFAFVGLSLGGAIGQVLALENPERLTALVLCCTVPKFGERSGWLERAAQVRAEGMQVLAEPTRGRWFTDSFRSRQPDEVERLIAMITATPVEGYAACCEALAGFDVRERLDGVSAPTRVIAAEHDQSAPVDQVRDMCAHIDGADLVVLDGVSHIANVADPARFDAAVLEHLERTP